MAVKEKKKNSTFVCKRSIHQMGEKTKKEKILIKWIYRLRSCSYSVCLSNYLLLLLCCCPTNEIFEKCSKLFFQHQFSMLNTGITSEKDSSMSCLWTYRVYKIQKIMLWIAHDTISFVEKPKIFSMKLGVVYIFFYTHIYSVFVSLLIYDMHHDEKQ